MRFPGIAWISAAVVLAALPAFAQKEPAVPDGTCYIGDVGRLLLEPAPKGHPVEAKHVYVFVDAKGNKLLILPGRFLEQLERQVVLQGQSLVVTEPRTGKKRTLAKGEVITLRVSQGISGATPADGRLYILIQKGAYKVDKGPPPKPPAPPAPPPEKAPEKKAPEAEEPAAPAKEAPKKEGPP
jgi:hypothetical protein